MTLSTNNLRVTLTFLENLNLVSIQVWTNDADHPLQSMGLTKGKNQLELLLEAVSIDHYLDFSGETACPELGSVPEALAIRCSPKRLVDVLEGGFQQESELDLKTLDGQPTSREGILKPPRSLTICSSSVSGAAGLQQIKGWLAGWTNCEKSFGGRATVNTTQPISSAKKQSVGR